MKACVLCKITPLFSFWSFSFSLGSFLSVKRCKWAVFNNFVYEGKRKYEVTTYLQKNYPIFLIIDLTIYQMINLMMN